MLRAVGAIVAAYLGYRFGDDVVGFIHDILVHKGRREDAESHIHDNEEGCCATSVESSASLSTQDASDWVETAHSEERQMSGDSVERRSRPLEACIVTIIREKEGLGDIIDQELEVSYKSAAESELSSSPAEVEQRKGQFPGKEAISGKEVQSCASPHRIRKKVTRMS